MHKVHYLQDNKLVCGLRRTNRRKHIGQYNKVDATDELTVTCKACLKKIENEVEK